MTSSEMVQRHLSPSKVVKAFYNQDAPHLLIHARPNDKTGRTTLPVSGDDADAKKAVIRLLEKIGYDALDAGSLAESWRVEPGSPIYVWPYAPKVPAGLSDEEAEVFYVTTPGPRVSAAEAQQLIAKAVRPKRVGGYPEDLPPVWVRVVGRWREVLQKAQSRSAEPGAPDDGGASPSGPADEFWAVASGDTDAGLKWTSRAAARNRRADMAGAED